MGKKTEQEIVKEYLQENFRAADWAHMTEEIEKELTKEAEKEHRNLLTVAPF